MSGVTVQERSHRLQICQARRRGDVELRFKESNYEHSRIQYIYHHAQFELSNLSSSLTLSCRGGGGGWSAPPLRFFAHNSEREKDNSTKFGHFS